MPTSETGKDEIFKTGNIRQFEWEKQVYSDTVQRQMGENEDNFTVFPHFSSMLTN